MDFLRGSSPFYMESQLLKKECFSIYCNLLKTTMGCGILQYPFLFKTYGIMPAILLTIVSASASFCGLVLYIDVNQYYGRANTMSSVAKYIWAPLKYVVDVTVIFKCYLVCVSYLILIKKQICGLIVGQANSNNQFSWLYLLVIVILISPFVLMLKLDRLKYTSSLGLLATVTLVLSSFYRAFSANSLEKTLLTTKNCLYIQNLGYFVFSFTCHQNIFTAQNEMKHNNKRALKYTCFLVYLTAAIIYIAFGWANYLVLGDNIEKDIFTSLPSDRLKLFVLIIYIALVTLSVPLQTNPCRFYLLNIFGSDVAVHKKYKRVQNIASFCIIFSAYLISIAEISFDAVCKFIGGSFSTLMCFIFGAIYYVMGNYHRGYGYELALALFSLFYGSLAFVSIFQ